MRTVLSDKVRIVYDDRGHGEPALLMLPGWCVSRTAFATVARRCSEQHRTLTLNWRGHGESEKPTKDFGTANLVDDALAVTWDSQAEHIVPVAMAHAGWVAIELRRRLGHRVPALVLLDWIVLEPPPAFLHALEGLQSPGRWQRTMERLFEAWLAGTSNVRVKRFLHEKMGAYGFAMWSRAAREISAAYNEAGSPLTALSRLEPPVPVLHLCSQQPDENVLVVQQRFATAHPWFHVQELRAQTHMVTLEAAEEIAAAVQQFVGEISLQSAGRQ